MQSPNSPNFPKSGDTVFPQLGTPISPSMDKPISSVFASDNPNHANSSLCGWLYKAKPAANSLSTADRPKKRWFIFSDETKELEYYRTPKDSTRLGVITIHDAAFIPDAEQSFDNLFSMVVTTSKKSYRLLHEEKSTLDYWRQTLQKRRSVLQETLLNEIQTSPILVQRSTMTMDSNNVTTKEASPPSYLSSPGALAPHLEVESAVHESNRFVGPHTRSQSSTKMSDVSVRNISIEARNTFRNITAAFRTGTAPIANFIVGHERDTTETSQNTVTDSGRSPPTYRPPSASITGSAGCKNMSGCDKCRQLRGDIQDLQDHIKAYEVQMNSLKMTLRLLSDNQTLNSSEKSIPAEVKRRLIDLESECNQLKTEVVAREEVIVDRDKQLSRLISNLEEMEKNPHLDSDIRNEFATMRHERDAYLDQNKSLNAEVLNLRLLFSASVDHEREMIDAIRKLYDVYKESSLRLKQRVDELSRPQLGERTEKDRLEMLTDAINEINPASPTFPEHLRNVLMEVSGELTDEYGFYVERRELNSQQLVDLTALGPDVDIQYFLEIPDMDYEKDASLTAKWERYLDEGGLTINDPRAFRKSLELKLLLRQGCTISVRPRIWKAMILFYVNQFRHDNGGEAFYSELVSNQRNSGFSIEQKQIDLDINRSLPENRFFNTSRATNADDLKIPALKRVLLSFCQMSGEVGYCQGLDRIASTLLLNIDEEMSFWGLHVIVRRLRSENYYTSSLRDAQIDQRVFKDLLAIHAPIVSQRLNQMDVDISLFSFNWFLTMFVDGFHWSIFMKIWDAFLCEGDKVLFRYAIAVVIYLEPILMRIDDAPSLYKVLRNAGRYLKDHRRLTEIAFSSLKSFPKRRIAQKRLHYGAIVDREIAKMNEERARLRARSFRENMFTNENDSGDEDYQDAKDMDDNDE